MTSSRSPTPDLGQNPLVGAAAAFLLGLICAPILPLRVELLLATAFACWLAWLRGERGRRHPLIPSLLLALSIASSGAALWHLNQRHLEASHVARFLPSHGDVPFTLRAAVLIPPDADRARDPPFLVRASAILTAQGWRPASGDLLVRASSSLPLQRGQHLELYGWAARPPPPLNPGGIDHRARLAADRIFVQLRIPRPGGIRSLSDTPARGPDPLTTARTWLRAKLLEHTLDHDVPAAYALSALLLGHRDPAISDISQSFADAGIAHLLAISGSHIVFFAWIAWCLCMLLPLPPRIREVLIAAIVALYVLATPCGPPIVRAAVALAMVVISRLAGRPGQYLNMLAAAAIVVILLRPADIADAGFQLSFASTAGLILLARRLYDALFGPFLERRTLIAEFADTPWAHRKLFLTKAFCAALVANLIGATAAAPLVAIHFGQVNLWAVPAGLLALPVVSLTLTVAALQLLAEVAGLGAWFAAPAIFCGKAMITLVQQLAALPGATLAVRPPPWWVVLVLYLTLALWIARRRLALSRACALNLSLAALILTAAWYTLSAPVGRLQLTVLSAGQASSALLRLPSGNVWALDAGARRGTLGTFNVRSALRVAGERRLAGTLLTALDASHSAAAAEFVERFDPARILLSQAAWDHRGHTLAGASLETALHGNPITPLRAGQTVALDSATTLEILWPPPSALIPGAADPPDVTADVSDHLIFTLTSFGKTLLIVDPRAQRPLAHILLARPGLRADVVLFTGPERGLADAPLRRLIAPLGAHTLLWNARGAWAPHSSSPGEWNAADGAFRLTFIPGGHIHIARAVPADPAP